MTPSAMEVHQFPCLSDNYSFMLHDPATGTTAVVDTPEVAPIEQALKETGWKLTHILNTHWHGDHTGGNEELKKKTRVRGHWPAVREKRRKRDSRYGPSGGAERRR